MEKIMWIKTSSWDEYVQNKIEFEILERILFNAKSIAKSIHEI